MLSKANLKAGEQFFYILPRYYDDDDNGEEHLKFIIASYKFWPEEHEFYDESRMFFTKAEAKKEVKRREKEEGY